MNIKNPADCPPDKVLDDVLYIGTANAHYGLPESKWRNPYSTKRDGAREGVVALYRFAAHIVLYAPCNTTYRDDDKITGKPIRMFHGAADDLFSIESCRAYVARLKQHGVDIELTEFPGRAVLC